MAEVAVSVADGNGTAVVTTGGVGLEAGELGISGAAGFAVGVGHHGASSL